MYELVTTVEGGKCENVFFLGVSKSNNLEENPIFYIKDAAKGYIDKLESVFGVIPEYFREKPLAIRKVVSYNEVFPHSITISDVGVFGDYSVILLNGKHTRMAGSLLAAGLKYSHLFDIVSKGVWYDLPEDAKEMLTTDDIEIEPTNT